MTHDAEIRASLLARLQKELPAGSVIVPEMGIGFRAVVDVGVLADDLELYEIKSDADTLRRLQSQVKAYDYVAARATIVCGERHLPAVLRTVPPWWGVLRALEREGQIVLETVRAAVHNERRDLQEIAKMMWVAELRKALARRCQGARTKKEMVLRLIEHAPHDIIPLMVRSLRARPWTLGGRQPVIRVGGEASAA